MVAFQAESSEPCVICGLSSLQEQDHRLYTAVNPCLFTSLILLISFLLPAVHKRVFSVPRPPVQNPFSPICPLVLQSLAASAFTHLFPPHSTLHIPLPLLAPPAAPVLRGECGCVCHGFEENHFSTGMYVNGSALESSAAPTAPFVSPVCTLTLSAVRPWNCILPLNILLGNEFSWVNCSSLRMYIGLGQLVFKFLLSVHFLVGHKACVCSSEWKKMKDSAARRSFANIEWVHMNFAV